MQPIRGAPSLRGARPVRRSRDGIADHLHVRKPPPAFGHAVRHRRHLRAQLAQRDPRQPPLRRRGQGSVRVEEHRHIEARQRNGRQEAQTLIAYSKSGANRAAQVRRSRAKARATPARSAARPTPIFGRKSRSRRTPAPYGIRGSAPARKRRHRPAWLPAHSSRADGCRTAIRATCAGRHRGHCTGRGRGFSCTNGQRQHPEVNRQHAPECHHVGGKHLHHLARPEA